MTDTVTRISTRFAAVLALDIAGYSRLMELDEAGTFARVWNIMNGIVNPSVVATGGRVVKLTGDGALAVWSDVAAATTCALQMQAHNEIEQRTRQADQRARFRVGLHAGEVIDADGDIFGDGVNVAARLESIAGVGEIYVSDAVAKAASGVCSFIDLGFRRLKNIARSIHIFRAARLGDECAGSGAIVDAPDLYVQGFGNHPAIAVLPFKNAGAGPVQDHLADGITEGVIIALSRWHSLPVISRNSTFAMRDRDLDLRMVGQQLGVRYVLEGSVRHAGQRFRTVVSLVDVATDSVLMSETYDCDLGEVFAMQDDIVRTIVGAIGPELLRYERERIMAAQPTNPTAYELVQLGLWRHYKYDRKENLLAREVLSQALAIEPGNVQGQTTLAMALNHAAHVGWEADKTAAHQHAMALARQAVEQTPRDPAAQFALGAVCQNTARPEEAAERLQTAIRFNPSHAAAHANLGFVHCFLDQPEEALPEIELALRLSPQDPRRFMWLPGMAASHYLSGRFRSALAASQDALMLNPTHPTALRYAAASLGAMDRVTDAKPILSMLRRLDGNLDGSAQHLRKSYLEPAAARLIDGLRRAGFD